MRELFLVRAVVVHHPDFFSASPRTDEDDLGFEDARDSAAEPEDDLISELVSDQAGVVVGCGFAVLLAEDLRVLLVVGIEEPSVHVEFAGCDGQVSEGEHGGVCGGVSPRRQLNVLWRGRRLHGVEGFRHEVEDAGVAEVVKERLVEGAF